MKRTETTILVLAILALTLSAALLHVRGVGGFNYDIYNYFSSLYYRGIDPYDAPAVSERDINESFKQPSYLDYTGLQLAVYNLCYLVRHQVWWRLDGFVLYSIALWLAAVIAAYDLRRKQGISRAQYLWFIAFLFAPYLWFRLFVISFEDKAVFLLLPLLILLARKTGPLLAGAIIGLASGLVGVPVLVLPVLLLSFHRCKGSPQHKTRQQLILVLGFALLFLISMIPFFPESLAGWTRRSNLESARPFWFSGWRLLGDLYFPGLNKVAVLICSVLVYVLYAKRRLTLKASVVCLLSFPMYFSVTMASQRILPAVATFVLGLSTKRGIAIYSIVAYASLLLFLWLDVTRGTFLLYPNHNALGKSGLLLFPATFGYFVVCIEAFRKTIGPSNAMDSDEE